jgi:hypothetical protein
MPPVGEAPQLQGSDEWPVETGFTVLPTGEARVSVRTEMPGVRPSMWDWWFAWHGSEAQRYKLWHPAAHVDAAWEDGRGDLRHYVGRVSRVTEYIGPSRLRLSIAFVPPGSVGLDEGLLATRGEIAVCARVGLAGIPVATGWLVHYICPTEHGAVMRSRFWVGGANLLLTKLSGPVGAFASRVVARRNRQNETQASQLLVHCAQEMNHLAGKLAELHSVFAEADTDHKEA